MVPGGVNRLLCVVQLLLRASCVLQNGAVVVVMRAGMCMLIGMGNSVASLVVVVSVVINMLATVRVVAGPRFCASRMCQTFQIVPAGIVLVQVDTAGAVAVRVAEPVALVLSTRSRHPWQDQVLVVRQWGPA